MKYNFLNAVAALSVAAAVFACKPAVIDPEPEPVPVEDPEMLILSEESLHFTAEGGKLSFTVMANYGWTVSAPDWISANVLSGAGDKAEHTVEITAGENPSDEADRTGEIKVSLPKGTCETITVSQDKKEKIDARPKSIATAEDLVNYLKNYAASDEAGTVMTFTSDINMTGVTVEPAADFAGVLDGMGHHITHWTTSTPLFMSNHGTVKNLTVDADCVVTAPGAENDPVHFGVFVADNYGTLTGCANHADIHETAASNGQNLYIAGLVGMNQAGSEISNCANYGNITFQSEACTGPTRLAGITCWNEAGSTVKDCFNAGKIHYNADNCSSSSKFIGGVIATNKGTVTKCINSKTATVIFDPKVANGNKCCTGGLIAQSYAGYITECKQFGDVIVNSNKDKSYSGGLIGFEEAITGVSTYGPVVDILDGCVVNCTITAQYGKVNTNVPAEAQNPLFSSVGYIVGRMSGQKGKDVYLHFGVNTPTKVAGAITNGTTEYKIDGTNVFLFVTGAGTGNNYTKYLENGSPIECDWQVYGVKYEEVTKE
ncbi:MAG: BACON domain-containing protein [Bacteroidales bacterium]|nr:BACON domain-containing protein [Bacteroidales bacterium]